ncbi:MAG: 30S ribosomal protein S3 [Clostridia bacterium]|nr:30S ribosomal protein S3 [Clostridia bacterium]
MGQKVNPHGLRVGVIKNWDSRWFVSDETFGDTLVSDHKVRKFLKTKYFEAGVPNVEIERTADRVKVFVHCAKPGLVIGKGGAEIENLRKELEKIVGKPVAVSVIEVRVPDMNAQLVAENIASQLEKRTSFRRAMKQSILRTMRAGAKGIKVAVSGRLGGAEIARSEHYHEGTIPLQTLRADIDYGIAEAHTTYGKIGVKVWIFKGEVLPDVKKHFTTVKPEEPAPARSDRRDRRPGGRRDGDRRPGDRRPGDRRPGGDRRFGDRRPQGQGQQGQGQGAPRRPFGGERKPFNKEGGAK